MKRIEGLKDRARGQDPERAHPLGLGLRVVGLRVEC